MKKFKKVQLDILTVVREKSNKNQLAFNRKRLTSYIANTDRFPYCKFQELYITSDDKIEYGDWCLTDKTIHQYENEGFPPKGARKIIATTNSSLQYHTDYHGKVTTDETKKCYGHKLACPPEKFVIEYVACYNKGEIMTEAMVEYTTIKSVELDANSKEMWNFTDIFKVDPENNTINIKKVKDNWSREEVELALHTMHISIHGGGFVNTEEVNNWIKENL